MTEPASDAKPIPFIDVAAQRRRLGAAIDAAIARVTEHCQFILEIGRASCRERV